MSVNYGDPPAVGAAYGGGGFTPPRRASLEWINEAWRFFSEQAGTWIVSCLLVILLPIVLYFIFAFVFGFSAVLAILSAQGRNGNLASGVSVGVIVAMILFWLAYALLYAPFIQSGVSRMAVRQVRGEPIGIGDIFGGGATTLKMLGFHIIYYLLIFLLSLVVIIPLYLLHIVSLSALNQQNPGTIGSAYVTSVLSTNTTQLIGWLLITTLFLPVFAQVADGESVFAAMSRSVAAIKTQFLSTLGILLLFGLLFIAGAIPCFLGWFIVFPMYWLLSALAYRDIIGMPGGNNAAALGMPGAYGTPQPGVWPPPPDARPPAFGQPPSSDPSSFSPPRRTLGGDKADENGSPPSGPAAA